jgi:hypothetical protein
MRDVGTPLTPSLVLSILLTAAGASSLFRTRG